MENTKRKQELLPEEAALEIAPFPSRILAAIVDWVALTALFVSLSRLVPDPDMVFVLNVVLGLSYFSLCHSSFTGGQTLGKRAFGLRLLSTADDGKLFVSSWRAATRYVLFLGLVVVLRDVPPIIFRMRGTVGPSELLELPMLVVLSYFLANVVGLVLDIRGQTLYDRLVRTIVVRAPRVPDLQAKSVLAKRPEASLIRRPIGYVPLGALLGAGLWFLSITAHADLKPMIESRYLLEHHLPVRVFSVARTDAGMSLELVRMDQAQEIRTLLESVGAFLRERDPAIDRLGTVEYTVFTPGSPEAETWRLALDTNTLAKVEAPPAPAS